MRESHITDPQERLTVLILRDEFRREMKAKAGAKHRGLSTDTAEVKKGSQPLAISNPDLNNMTVDRRLLARAGVSLKRKYTTKELDELLDRTRLSNEQRIAVKTLVEASGCLVRDEDSANEKLNRHIKKTIKQISDDSADEDDFDSDEEARKLGKSLRKMLRRSRRIR